MKNLVCLLLCLCMMAPALALAEDDGMDAYVKNAFRKRGTVGGAVIIAKDGEILYSTGWGRRGESRKNPVTVDTCFRIASVTKMISGIGLMKLLKEKNVSPDTPVSEILGFPVVNPWYKDTPVTVRQVMSHTSSIRATMSYFPTWEKMGRGTPYFAEKTAPGEGYEYSNLNGGLLGAMIEALSGQSVNSYMQENVFDPLGVNAAYHPGLLRDTSDLADRLNADGSVYQHVTYALSTLKKYSDTCDPRQHTNRTAGGLYISAQGIYRVLAMLQNDGEWNGVRILPEGAAAEMMADQSLIPGSSVHCKSPYGLNVIHLNGMTGGTWYGHQGRVNGLTTDAFFQPDTGLIAVVIGNGHGDPNHHGIATLAYDIMEKAQMYAQ